MHSPGRTFHRPFDWPLQIEKSLTIEGSAAAGMTISGRLLDKVIASSGEVAAIAMRRILVDRARSRRRIKRGGAQIAVPLENVDLTADERADLVVALDEALDRLRKLDDRQARLVECRFFGGMTEDETAEALGIGVRTAKRDWARRGAGCTRSCTTSRWPECRRVV